MAAKGTLERTRDALRSPDFRRLFLVRLASQFADGLFQVSLIASVVFSPDKQSTTIGLFKATLVIALPYSVIGPFTGVFIDRWRRRRILVVAPWVKTGLVWLVLFDPVRAPGPVLLRRVARDLGEPLLPGDRAGRGAAPGPDRGPADGELPRDRRRHGRVARRRLPGRSDLRRVREHRHGHRRRRAVAGRLLVGLADPQRPGAAHDPRGSLRCSVTSCAGSERSSSTGSSASSARRGPSDRSRRSRSTSWARAWC